MQKRIVKTESYCGEDRRGIKIGKDLWYRVGYALLIAAMILGVYRTRFEVMGIEQKAQADELKEQKEKIAYMDKDIVVLKTELPIIKEDIKDIKMSQSEMQKDIKLLLRKTPDG